MLQDLSFFRKNDLEDLPIISPFDEISLEDFLRKCKSDRTYKDQLINLNSEV
jgi:hypothetical protein